MKKYFLLLSSVILINTAFAQQHKKSKTYEYPTDPLVLKKLHHWQKEKFGLLMHWGTYSEWGIVESWSICPEDEGWTQRKGPYADNYFDYVKAYENLQTTFNPIKFNPDKWATAAKDAGMKYVVFTTKHHDGFCMFDTHQTDYKVTSSKTPFSSNPKANIAKEVFKSFRKDSFMIGAYFSKPDWHSQDYWWPYFPPKDRNVNYDPAKYPQRWNDFKNFVYNQINELTTGYGSVDILWLDGGWVRPLASVDKNVDWQKGIRYNQDIDMPRIAAMARKNQPGILIVDRTVPGKYENYQTPEQTVPDEPLNNPWESCITLGNSWSYVPNDHYKTANYVVHLLIKIVSRGGNLLLNIGPSPEGDWSDTAYSRLKDIGAWMHVYGDAVYDSKPLAPYEENNIVYTQSEDGKAKYIFILSDEKNDVVTLPQTLHLPEGFTSKQNKISILGTKEKLKWNAATNEIVFPKKSSKNIFSKYAVVLKVE
ncbi:alpha-L-fucosidase [Arachidicoccus ginsenosidimutans]|uniref:alpha-L-fucosidase n=1 Tax=Arachidicoccus sp. BS20 TaxID=1850526 RepID=UPI0007F0D0FB|nr:alpha-L-fucosidase [Arachidicoccus sp. BS20]ANI90445.1 alpha-L-fucosidase [Arachidicoccus sp. BS20]